MRYLIKFILTSLFAVFFVSLVFSQSGKLDINAFDKYVKKSMSAWKVPGMAIAIVHNDSVIFAKGFGVRDINKKDEVDQNTLFAIASLSKAFTSAALSQLVDQGLMRWDDKAIDYIPYFRTSNPQITQEVTIRDLLCHRIGFETFSGDLLWYKTNFNRRQVIEKAQYLKLPYNFRSQFGYSNIMFLVAGEIIPVVTGKTWDVYIRQEFFNPLGMKRSNTSVSQLEVMENVATPHVEYQGKTVAIPYMKWDNVAPAAAINSSVLDMAQWIKLQLNEGKLGDKVIISKEAQFEMWSPQTIQTMQQSASKIWPSRHFRMYGLGWEMFDYQGHKIVCHSGGADGMISEIVLVPEEELGMIVLSNSISSLPSALMYEFIDMYMGTNDTDWSSLFLQFKSRYDNDNEAKRKEFEKNRVLNTSPSLPLEKYKGVYGGIMYGNAEVDVENNKLIVKLLPASGMVGELTHWHYNTFKIKLRDMPQLPEGTVLFNIDKNGQTSGFEIDIPNPDFDFTELKFERISN